MKRFLVITIALIIIIGGTGCMFKYPAENINDLAIEYMENKYGEKFEYFAPYGDSITGTHQLLVTCDSYPEQGILVRIENYRKKEERVFRDNYLAVKYKGDTTEFIKRCAEEVFTEANIYYDVSNQVLSADLPANASFEEYVSDASLLLQMVIEVESGHYSSERQIDTLAELVSASVSRFNIPVIVVEDEEFGQFSKKELGKKIAYGHYARCAEITKLSDEIIIRWLEESGL